MGLDLDGLDSDEDDEAKDVEIVEDGQSEEPDGAPLEVQEPSGGSGPIQMAGELDEIAETYEKFERLKTELLDKSTDIEEISGRPFITKSGWRKVSTAFNVTVETTEDNVWVEGGVVKAKVRAVAKAPNGKVVSALSQCDSTESNFTRKHSGAESYDDAREEASKFWPGGEVPDDAIFHKDGVWRSLKRPNEVSHHNVLTIAATRAKNRAISDLVGGGEVSAEEMDADFYLE